MLKLIFNIFWETGNSNNFSKKVIFFFSTQKGWTEVKQPMVVASDRSAEPKVKMKKKSFNRLIHLVSWDSFDKSR